MTKLTIEKVKEASEALAAMIDSKEALDIAVEEQFNIILEDPSVDNKAQALYNQLLLMVLYQKYYGPMCSVRTDLVLESEEIAFIAGITEGYVEGILGVEAFGGDIPVKLVEAMKPVHDFVKIGDTH